MAKQIGIHGLRGKVNGMSYYGSKVGGSLVRKINEGLGERVKTGKEYANTRKNNAEFGMCGDLAGAFIKPFTIRWRFLLDSIATGKMVKKLKELVVLDSTGAWGQRVLKDTYFEQVREKWNTFSKNEMESEIISILNEGVTQNPSTKDLEVIHVPVMSTARAQELIDLGANYFYTKVFALSLDVPQFNAGTQSYEGVASALVELNGFDNEGNIDVSNPASYFDDTTSNCSLEIVDTSTKFGALAVVFLPARKVGTSISILQQHCSAYMVPVTAGSGE